MRKRWEETLKWALWENKAPFNTENQPLSNWQNCTFKYWEYKLNIPNKSKKYSVICYLCDLLVQYNYDVSLIISNKDNLKGLVESIINYSNYNDASKDEIEDYYYGVDPCQHQLELTQEKTLDFNKNFTACSNCSLSSNLWFCLTCGYVGCGRKQFDGTGGNNHAKEHFQSNKTHSIVVKLVSIDSTNASKNIKCN